MFRVMTMGLLFLFFAAQAWADEEILTDDEAGRIQTQSRLERRKEEEIQLLRLDLERLKLEMEMRKVFVEMGNGPGALRSDAHSASGPLVKINGVFVSSAKKVVAMDLNGKSVNAAEGDSVEGMRVLHIGDQVVRFQSDTGAEWEAPLP